MYLINNQQIKYLCSYHGLVYGKQKKLTTPIQVIGICSVCAEEDQKNALQTVFHVDDFQGLYEINSVTKK